MPQRVIEVTCPVEMETGICSAIIRVAISDRVGGVMFSPPTSCKAGHILTDEQVHYVCHQVCDLSMKVAGDSYIH